MKQILFIASAVVVGVVLIELLIPRSRPPAPPPVIITVHDTVYDTVRLRGPRVVTTDTVQLVIRETVHDTVQINIGSDTAQRSALWPILNLQVGKSRGDTTRATTFSLRSGKPTVSLFWTPGPLKSVWSDSTMTPRVDFYEPAKPQGVSLWTKVKWSSIGALAGRLSCQ